MYVGAGIRNINLRAVHVYQVGNVIHEIGKVTSNPGPSGPYYVRWELEDGQYKLAVDVSFSMWPPRGRLQLQVKPTISEVMYADSTQKTMGSLAKSMTLLPDRKIPALTPAIPSILSNSKAEMGITLD